MVYQMTVYTYRNNIIEDIQFFGMNMSFISSNEAKMHIS